MRRRNVQLEFEDYETFSYFLPAIRTYLQGALTRDSVLLEVAVNEAINNAFAHGVTRVLRPRIRLRMSVVNDRLLMIRVRDNGPGFDWRAQLAQERGAFTDNLEKLRSSGRGIHMIRLISDRLVFNQSGNEVLLVKHMDTAERGWLQ